MYATPEVARMMFRPQNLDAIISFGWMSKAFEIGAFGHQ
jgi:hypothetical protein